MAGKKPAGRGTWSKRPGDPECTETEPVDPDIVGLIGQLVENWQPGDFDTALAVLIEERPELAAVKHTLSPRFIGQACHAAVFKGARQRSTAHSAVVQFGLTCGKSGDPTNPEPADQSQPSFRHLDVAAKLTDDAKAVLREILKRGHTSPTDATSLRKLSRGKDYTWMDREKLPELIDEIERLAGKHDMEPIGRVGKHPRGRIFLTGEGQLLAKCVG